MFEWPLMVNNVDRKDLDAIIHHLRDDDPKLTHGPKVKEFEEKWSNWVGVKYSVMVNSGASANDLTMKAIAEIYGKGEVIVPPLTWVSDIASVMHAGHTPVFVDINLTNLSFDLDKLLSQVNKNTKAIFLTHVLGINALTDELIELCKERGVLLIEDVCESHGAVFHSKKAGSIGFASNFSFYYAHHMTTIEGGMICTDDEDFYQVIRMLRSHGMVRESSSSELRDKYAREFSDLNPDFIFAYGSHNMRPTEINGIMGISQLERLDDNVIVRTSNFKKFLELLNPLKFNTDLLFEGSSSYAFPIILKRPSIPNRDRVELALRNAGIEFRRGLSGGGNQIRQPYVKSNLPAVDLSDFPNIDHIHFYSWYVGNYPSLDPKKIEILCALLNEACE